MSPSGCGPQASNQRVLRARTCWRRCARITRATRNSSKTRASKVNSGDTPLDAAAGFAATLRFCDLPEAVVERAKYLLLDTLGVMIAGTAERRVGQLSRVLRSRGS